MKKHILCLGDSNTHGLCADPADTEDGGIRFTENERWTCLLQKALGEEYLITEEGLSGRTTVFPDPLHESMDAVSVLYQLLKSHEYIDLLVIMLGTNDTKERYSASAPCIAMGLHRLVQKAMFVDCWEPGKAPNILISAPPPIGEGFENPVMGKGCREKSLLLSQYYAQEAASLGCHFLDAAGCELNNIDHVHFTRKGHAELAKRLAEIIPQIS